VLSERSRVSGDIWLLSVDLYAMNWSAGLQVDGRVLRGGELQMVVHVLRGKTRKGLSENPHVMAELIPPASVHVGNLFSPRQSRLPTAAVRQQCRSQGSCRKPNSSWFR